MTAPDSEAYAYEDECIAAPRLLIRDEHKSTFQIPLLSRKSPCAVTGEFPRAASSNTATAWDSSSNAVSRILERAYSSNHTRCTEYRHQYDVSRTFGKFGDASDALSIFSHYLTERGNILPVLSTV
jgi:hypothetical protein